MIKRFNEFIADKLAYGLSSMACFWLIAALVLLTLVFQVPVGAQAWVLFVVSVFFQGVALPVLGFVAKKEGERQMALLTETHEAVVAELAELKAIHQETHAKVAEIHAETTQS